MEGIQYWIQINNSNPLIQKQLNIHTQHISSAGSFFLLHLVLHWLGICSIFTLMIRTNSNIPLPLNNVSTSYMLSNRTSCTFNITVPALSQTGPSRNNPSVPLGTKFHLPNTLTFTKITFEKMFHITYISLIPRPTSTQHLLLTQWAGTC